MAYEKIDQSINEWCSNKGFLVLREDREPFRRYFYISSSRGEIFQVVIEPEHNNSVRMDLHLIEGLKDEEVDMVWTGPSDDLTYAFEIAEYSARSWFDRSTTTSA